MRAERAALAEAFGKRLRGVLAEKGMTQAQLAEEIGTSEVSMSRYCTGVRLPRQNVQAKIANALSVTEGELLRGSVERGEDAEVTDAFASVLGYLGKYGRRFDDEMIGTVLRAVADVIVLRRTL